MQLKMSKDFKEKVAGRFNRFELEVGILQDSAHKEAKPASRGLGTYAGGPVRKKGPDSGLRVSDVSEAIRARMDINYLTEPFNKRSPALTEFMVQFFRMAAGRSVSLKKRVENALQAVVRNPILRGEYGSNGPLTKREKTFDRYLIDTGQFFKAITASVKVRR
jgi:hypothetical protein